MDAEAQLLEVCNELLIKIRETPENKKCFDCSDTTSPRYVCTDFSTLVCSCCANIHMEFGHSIKCLNLFAFTLNEILSLRDSGNKFAAYKWLATWSLEDFPEPDPTSLDYKENARAYMKAKYVEKKWARDAASDFVSSETTVTSDTPEDWATHLHDEKVPSPHLSHRAKFAANNPFVSSSSPSSPYISTPSRMSFPPQSGCTPAVTIDLQQYSKFPLSVPPSNSSQYNPFADESEGPHNNKELIRSRTLLDLNNFNKTPSEESEDDDTFKPVVRIRSASAHALLHCGSENNIVRVGGKVILPSGQELKFPSKALPPRPDEKKEVTAPASVPVLVATPASPPPAAPTSPREIASPTAATAKEVKEQEKPSTAATILKSPLRINTLVKALSLKVNSPTADAAPTTPLEGEGEHVQPIGESPEKDKPQQAPGSAKIAGIMNKMSSLLAVKKPSTLKL